MKTFLNQDIPEDARGILYICWYNHEAKTIEVLRSFVFPTPYEALQAYANTPNPESQMASGETREEFEQDLMSLHNRLRDPKWVAELSEYL